jgi:hypothetical protein
MAGAPIVVSGLDAVPKGLDDPARAADFLRAVASLAREIPRAQRTVAV